MGNRRTFFRQATAALGALQVSVAQPRTAATGYPRIYSGQQLKMIAFPLGGVGAGSLSLGGRGQLRDWEIFNKPNKGFSPNYAFPSIWARARGAKPVTRVLEARILPPYEGQDGLGSNNAPGLSRLESAKFTGEYPLARIDFEDRALPVKVSLEAFSPFIPHEADDSGLPVAILRYRVKNPNAAKVDVSIAFSIDNPAKGQNEPIASNTLSGLLMHSPELPSEDPMRGEFVLSAISVPGARADVWRGWPQGRWWNSPMLFWDDFSDDGRLSAEPNPHNAVGVLCVQQTISANSSADFTFVLAWRFPNRTLPEWCGWTAPKGQGKAIIGNHYCTRFPTALAAAEYAVTNLQRLETQTRLFAHAFRESTLPAAVKEAASANLSTLASTTCFRTADGEFHGFEGADDHRGCCFGNCTHVWNYESATPHLFPTLARSLRAAAFGYSMDDAGAMHFRQMLPDGVERSGFAATDETRSRGRSSTRISTGRSPAIMEWLRRMWPRIKKGLEFAWIPGGWDADKDGVLEGVQHNTYDVEFYGPNPLCSIYYLAALRAGEEMALAVGDAAGCGIPPPVRIRPQVDRRQFIQRRILRAADSRDSRKIKSHPVAAQQHGRGRYRSIRQYQVGEGCLVDQLIELAISCRSRWPRIARFHR